MIGNNIINNMGDKLLLNFGATFECQVMISLVKLQCCFSAKMASRLLNVTDYNWNLSRMILIAIQMVCLWNLRIISFPWTKDSGNYLILDKTLVKLSPKVTCHHLITYSIVRARAHLWNRNTPRSKLLFSFCTSFP